MTLKEIVAKFNGLKIYEKRSEADRYWEIVFYTEDAAKWNKALTDILGIPPKPSGKKASDDDRRLTIDFGGIQDNQILYKKDFGNNTIIAMLWPWQDGAHITLKMASLENSREE